MPAETPIQVRRGTASAWTSANPTLLAGELGFETDTLKFKIGNGSSTWTALSYQGGGGVTVQETEPSSPSVGNLWYKSDTGQTFIYYDGDWEEVGPPVIDSVLQRVDAKGDILVATAADNIGVLNLGANGTVLAVNTATSTGVAWTDISSTYATNSAAVLKSVVDAKGDLIVGTANDTTARFGVGSDNALLIADSTQTSGMRWGATLTGLTLTSPIANSPTLNYASLVSPEELWTVSASAVSGTPFAIDLMSSSTFLYTGTTSADWTFNFRGNTSTTLNTMLPLNYSITVAVGVTHGTTPYRATGFQIDGASVTPQWQGGSAPSAGNASSVDMYVFTIVKTAVTPTYRVFASLTRFA